MYMIDGINIIDSKNEFMKYSERIAWKVKGEKHSASKVKTLKPVDEVFEQKKIDFVNTIGCTASRLEQHYDETFDTLNGGKGDIKRTGDYIRAVINDIMKEEMDLFIEWGIEPKQINGMVSKVARDFLMTKLDEEAGL